MRLGVAAAHEDPKQHTRDIGVENGRTLAEREASNGASGVRADPLERQQRFCVRRQLAIVSGYSLARNRVQPARPDVIAEGPPRARDVNLRRLGECLKRRILREPFVILRKHSIHLAFAAA